MAKNRKESKEKKLIKCVKAPFRLLISIKNFYIYSMIRCSGHVRAGTTLPARHIDGLQRMYSVDLSRQWSTSLALDEDFRELMKAASNRRLPGIIHSDDDVLQRQKSDRKNFVFSEPCFIHRSSTVTGMGTIKEEEPCEFGWDDVNVRVSVLSTRLSHRFNLMGNCQTTTDAEVIVIYHPGIGCKGSYKIYRSSSVTAEEIMVLYPGYYVSLLGTFSTEEGIRLKQLKLLRPRDTLSIGRVYRLIRFEDVPLELSARTRGKLVARGGGDEAEEEEGGGQRRKKGPSGRMKSRTSNCCSCKVVEGTAQIDGSDTSTTSSSTTTPNATTSSSSRMHSRQWRPSLESISEFGV